MLQYIKKVCSNQFKLCPSETKVKLKRLLPEGEIEYKSEVKTTQFVPDCEKQYKTLRLDPYGMDPYGLEPHGLNIYGPLCLGPICPRIGAHRK